jgi:hypothetical protein
MTKADERGLAVVGFSALKPKTAASSGFEERMMGLELTTFCMASKAAGNDLGQRTTR